MSKIQKIAKELRDWTFKEFGEHCPDIAEGCYTCQAWKICDELEKFADHCDSLDKEYN